MEDREGEADRASQRVRVEAQVKAVEQGRGQVGNPGGVFILSSEPAPGHHR